MEHINDPIEKERAWEDLGRPENSIKPVVFAYTVLMDKDGILHTQISEVTDEVTRKATIFDVYASARDLVADIDAQLLADRVAALVVDRIKPTDEAKELREKLLSALNDRGIETPKA